MCIACEQDAMWFAYLRRKGLLTPEGYLVEEPPSVFAANPVEPAAGPEEAKADSPLEPEEKEKLAGDDQTA